MYGGDFNTMCFLEENLGGSRLNASMRKEISWHQKSKIKWVREGDVNSKFFHKTANGRRRKSLIKELEVEGGQWDNTLILEEVIKFFVELYIEEVIDNPFLEGLEWFPISGSKAKWLERQFEEEEVSS